MASTIHVRGAIEAALLDPQVAQSLRAAAARPPACACITSLQRRGVARNDTDWTQGVKGASEGGCLSAAHQSEHTSTKNRDTAPVIVAAHARLVT
jgi:hypothetical protein